MKKIHMFKPIIDDFESQCYEILEQHKRNERGTEMIDSNDGQRLLVELNGEKTAFSNEEKEFVIKNLISKRELKI